MFSNYHYFACITDRNTDYMAFGLSGSDSGILMVGSDVVVTDFKDGGDPRAKIGRASCRERV